MKHPGSRLILLFALITQSQVVKAQCTGGTSAGSVSPTNSFQTVCIQGGNYITLNASQGATYLFSFCQGGASASFDTEITINDNTGTSVIAYNDDYCGTGSELSFTAPATSTYRILITQYTCVSTASCATLAFKVNQSNDNICSPVFLNPRCTSNGYYTYSNVGATNSPQASPGCAGYTGGDVWFSTIVPYSGSLIFTSQTNVITDGGMAIYSGSSCSGSLTLVACDDNSGPGNMPEISLTGLTPGDSLYIRFWENGNNSFGSFDIAVYDSNPFYCMTGSATQIFTNGCLQITPNTQAQSGCVWNKTQINMASNFDYNFTVNLGSNDAGADGLAFTLQNNAAGMAALGNPGYQLGIAPVTNSVIVEFDTYNNGTGVKDVPGDHIAVSLNGDIANPVAGPINAIFTNPNIEDGLDHTVRITWNASTQNFRVYFDGTLKISYTADLINTVFGGNPMVYWGFSGSTGLYTNSQSICPGTLPGAPLPVDWSEFEAYLENKEVTLKWISSKELNTDQYIIERSTDGKEFSEIGRINAAGNSSRNLNYHFTDRLPLSGINYYRIKQTDLNSAYSYSAIKAVKSSDLNQDISFEFFPNPVKSKNNCNVNLSGLDKGEITFLDNMGNQIFTSVIENGTNNLTLPQHIPAGLYLANLKTADKLLTKAVVIQE